MGVLFIVVFTCACYGVTMFEESYEFLTYTDDSIAFECCSRLSQSFFMHFQLLVGAEWHSIMYATALDWGFVACLYFVVYMLVINVLLTDLVVGVIMTYYSISTETETIRTKSDQIYYNQLMDGKKLRIETALEAEKVQKEM